MANIKTEVMGLVKKIQKVLLDDRYFFADYCSGKFQSIFEHELNDYIHAVP